MFTANVSNGEGVIGRLNELLCDYTVSKNAGNAQKYIFLDVNTSDWYYGYVAKAVELGIINGIGDGKFAPNGLLKLYEAVTLACKAHAFAVSYDIIPPSPPGSAWYQPYIDYALANGIIEEGEFGDLAKNATREEMAAIFARAVPGEHLIPINEVDFLPDVSEYGFYGSLIFSLYRAGVITGTDDRGTFNPHSRISRAEAAALIVRVIDLDERIRFELE